MSRPASAGRRRRESSTWLSQLPSGRVFNPLPPIEPLSADQIERIHEASLTVLEEIGMEFLHPEALQILKDAGAEVTPGSTRVRLDRGLVMEAVAKAPSSFGIHSRNPDRTVGFGGSEIVFASIGSAPNVSDLEGGRRVGNFRDYCNLIRLCQAMNAVHMFGGYPVEPVDLPPSTRHLDALRAFVTLSDKPFHAYSLGRGRILDGIEIARISRGIDRETLAREPSLFTIVNTSSPLRLDGPMIEGVIEMARARQITVITPFTLSGAMAPATIAGALVEQNAEALAGIALIQLVNPGAPAMYGGFTSNVDMKTGAPAFGTPEYVKATLIGGQLARRYRLPYRSSNANASNAVDAQATWESEMSLWAVVMGHANFVMHAAGWLEGGLRASFEKIVLDCELIQHMVEVLKPVEINEDTLALDAIREVGPGGHFFGAAHTLARYEHAFYGPFLSDWRNFESWQEAGAQDATQRAHQIYKRVLAEFEPPPLDPAVADELDAFVAKRKEEGGVKTD